MGLKMPRGNIGCQSGSPLKESFVSPSSWVRVAAFSFTTFFPSFQVCHSVMSVSGVCAGTWLNMRQQCVRFESRTLTTQSAVRQYRVYILYM